MPKRAKAKLRSHIIPGLLSGEAFDAAIVESVKIARHHMYTHCKLIDVVKENDKTIIKCFGGTTTYIVDHAQKKVYEAATENQTSDKDFNIFIQPFSFQTNVFTQIQTGLKKAMTERGMLPHDQHNTFVRQMKLSDPSQAQNIWDELHRQSVLVNRSCMLVINTCWGKNCRWAKAVGVIGKVLWENLNREIAGYAIKIAGRKTSSIHYSLVWNNLDEVRKVNEYAAGILPIWGEVAKFDGAGIDECNAQTNSLIRPNIIEDVKSHLEKDAANPLTKRAWRFLVKQKPLWVMYLLRQKYEVVYKLNEAIEVQHDWDGDADLRQNAYSPRDCKTHIMTLNRVLDFYAEVNEIPKFTTYLRMARMIKGRRVCQALVSFVRAVFIASRKKPAKKFITEEVELAWDWYKNYGIEQMNGRPIQNGQAFNRDDVDPVLDRNQLNSPWTWFMRQQKEWHERVTANAKLKILNSRWVSLVPELKYGNFTVVPLVSSHELYEDGKALHHCVSSYSNACEQGRSRIFSIQKDGERLATFEIVCDSLNSQQVLRHEQLADPTLHDRELVKLKTLNWRMTQARGHCNAAVPENLRKIAAATCDKYIQACDLALSKARGKPPSENTINDQIQEVWDVLEARV